MEWRPYKVRSLVSNSIYAKKYIEMAFPVSTKSLLKMSSDAAMLFAPSGYTHPLPALSAHAEPKS